MVSQRMVMAVQSSFHYLFNPWIIIIDDHFVSLIVAVVEEGLNWGDSLFLFKGLGGISRLHKINKVHHINSSLIGCSR